MKQNPAYKLWLLAALLAIVVVTTVMSRNKSHESPQRIAEPSPPKSKVKQEPRSAITHRAKTPRDTTRPRAETITVRARLLGGADVKAAVSAGTISAEDWTEINAQATTLTQNEKPKSPLDFAHYQDPEWITPTPDDQHNGTISFSWAPLASVYRIEAIRPSDNAWYHARVELPKNLPATQTQFDFGDITPILPTGLRLSFANVPKGHEDFLIGLQRRPDEASAQRASELLTYVEKVRPDILATLREEESLTANAAVMTTIAPLPPDPSIRITFRTLTGIEGKPVELPLKDQQVVDATIDLGAVFEGIPSTALSLRGRLLLGNSDTGIANASIERESAPLAGAQTTDADGSFSFEGIPPGVECTFNATIPRDDSPRPRSPSQATFKFTAPPDATGQQVVEWRVPAYQWIVLKLDSERANEIAQLAKNSPIRQPIFILQRNTSGLWIDEAADEFIPAPDEVAISVTARGNYRVAVAANPLFTILSTEAPITSDAPETIVTLTDFSREVPQRTLAISTHDGNPLKEGRVWLNGAYRSAPPIALTIPPSGIIPLPPLNAQILNVAAAGPGFDRIATTVTVGEDRDLKVQLPPP